MKMGYDLSLNQKQQLVMTSEMIQGIELLQCNTFQLSEILKNEMLNNPVIEAERIYPEFCVSESGGTNDAASEIDWELYVEKYGDISYKREKEAVAEKRDYLSTVRYEPTLREFLLEQLSLSRWSVGDRAMAKYMINSINENGYLMESTLHIALEFRVAEQTVERVLHQIQRMEPLGVGARNLKECLLIQARAQNYTQEELRIIQDHLTEVAENKLPQIAKKLQLSIERIQECCDRIRRLEPKPGASFRNSYDSNRWITPEARIDIENGQPKVVLLNCGEYVLNINPYYQRLFQSTEDQELKTYLEEKLNSAAWLIRCVERRKSTIRRVIEAIVAHQIEFFTSSGHSLKSMTLRDVAEAIEMHESTVSRAVNGKFVQTEYGIFELKYFFGSALSSKDGTISSANVKEKIRLLIEQEDRKKPITDSKICTLLNSDGINISRRTVAKYREELGIECSGKRRRF